MTLMTNDLLDFALKSCEERKGVMGGTGLVPFVVGVVVFLVLGNDLMTGPCEKRTFTPGDTRGVEWLLDF